MTIETEGYERLAAAIVNLAVKDYRKAFMELKDLEAKGRILNIRRRKIYKKKRERLTGEMKRIENFFFSDYFHVLTNVDPVALMEKMKKEEKAYEPKRVSKPSRKSKDWRQI